MPINPRTLKVRKYLQPAAVIVFLLLLGGCGKDPKKAPAPPPVPVTVADVKQGKVPIVMEFSGTIQAIRTVDIIPRVSGYIDKRYFEEGTFVEKDAPLYLIDPRPYQARVDAAAAQVKLDEANQAFWRAEAKRYQSAAKAGAVSKEKLDEALTQRSKAMATVAKGKADLENMLLDLSFTNITAPFAGRVQETRINIGNLVEQQKDVLTTLVQMDPIYVVFNISRARVYEIQLLKREGKVLPVKDMRAEVELPDASRYPEQGKINFISFQIDPTTDSILVRAVFPNKHDKEIGDFNLIPGQYAPVRLILGDEPDALLIPQPALVESQIGKQVFVVGQDNKVSVRTVEVGRGYQNQWVVRKGLKKGEKVIVDGTQKVKPGVVVKATAYKEGEKDNSKGS
ncbi:MAG: efflux RND transporter periplasmic adaptor subunit [Desulfobacterales bacterium]|jgi:membrane fusion protein (multidrug efflux system)